MLKTNKDKLVQWSVQGKIHHPIGGDYRMTYEGKQVVIPSIGGINYNVTVGDSAFNWVGDHIEPCISIRNENKGENDALSTFSCIGNTAKVISGDAKGALGYVIGKHGGVDHVIIHFEDHVLEELAIDDKILVKSYGQGLKLLDYEDIHLMNIDPYLFEHLKIVESNGKIQVPVVAKIPGYLMGSGIGSKSAYIGDYDLMTSDWTEVERLGLDKLKLGDFVLLQDCDNTYGRVHLKGAVSIGVLIHCDSIQAGHGPGITTIMSCKTDLIEGIIDLTANLKKYIRK